MLVAAAYVFDLKFVIRRDNACACPARSRLGFAYCRLWSDKDDSRQPLETSA